MSKHLEHKNLIARWMDGRLNKAEKEQLDDTGELDALKTVLDDIDTWKVTPFDVDAGLAELQKKKSEVVPLKKTTKTAWLRIAASITMLLSCGLLWYFVSNGTTTESTEIAEKKTIELPEGSLVELDAASSIIFDKKDWENSRSLSLSGQAFFDVTSGVPFLVKTPTAKVSVLGTQFNIKTDKERFSAFCYKGKIEVSYKGDVEIISMGQSVVLENGKLLKSQHRDIAPEWIKGYSSYDKTSLLDVVADVQRYYEVEITLPKKYAQLQFTGTIAHDDLKRTLNTIFTTMEIGYTLKEDGKVIVD